MVLAAGAAFLGVVAVLAAVSLARSERTAVNGVRGPAAAAPGISGGEPVAPTPEMRNQLGPVHGNAAVYRLAHVGSRVFYRVESERDGTCYAAGYADRFGLILCPGERATGPLVDLSTVDVTPDSGEVRVLRLQGVAAPRIRRVRLLDDGGSLIVEAPASAGAYYVDDVPPRPAGSLLALDARGNVVHRSELRHAP